MLFLQQLLLEGRTDGDSDRMKHAESGHVPSSSVISCVTTLEASVAMLSAPIKRFRQTLRAAAEAAFTAPQGRLLAQSPSSFSVRLL